MKYSWLKKTNSEKLIIFFNGWGMDEYIVSHLDCGEYDVVGLYDYSDLTVDTDFGEYEEKHIVAWSMGVMIGTLFDFGDIQSSTAICGTPIPISDKFGIPERIYNLTIKGFCEKSVEKFMSRMFIEKPNIAKFSNRTIDSQKTELIKLLEYKNKDFTYTKSIVGDNDLIIPTKNQLNYWNEPIIIHSGHCPFMLFKSWSEIIEL